MPVRFVAGFRPSTSGLRFANAFPSMPVLRIGIPGVISLPIGDASNGLCGGMTFTARDYFEAGRSPPPVASPPTHGPLYEYLVGRLFDSFDLPLGPARYLELMNPLLPDGETLWSVLGLTPHGRSWRMVRHEWPLIRADIDADHPSPLGLVRVKSVDPFALKHNHQVLAYGYEVIAARLTLHLYDPNLPGRDDVRVSLGLNSPDRALSLATVPSGPPVYSFFRVSYSPAVPP